jgi:hypothetical protein
MSKVRNIAFDCNESILDLASIAPVFQRLFRSPGAMRLWFQPQYVGKDLNTVADQIIARNGAGQE